MEIHLSLTLESFLSQATDEISGNQTSERL